MFPLYWKSIRYCKQAGSGWQLPYSGIMESRMGRAGAKKDDQGLESAVCRRVRDLRKARGWTLEEMSAACGVSRSMLSEIERGGANPTLAVASRIAQAFELSLGELVDPPGGGAHVDVIRADDPAYHYRSDKRCRIRTLSPLHLEKSVEFYELIFPPGGQLRSLPHFSGTRELLTVHHGTVRVTSGGTGVDLGRGDSAHYRADLPHAITNTGRGEAVTYLVVTYTQT